MGRAGGFFAGRRRVWAGLACAAMGLAAGQGLWGLMIVNGVVQQEPAATPEAGEDGDDSVLGFVVAKEDSKTLDKLEDFNRYAEKKSWELAFRTMNSLAETEGTGMVPTGKGFMMPLRRRIAQTLATLPAEGRDAYRLFYDAEAKQLWERVKDARVGGGPEEMRGLQKITTRFFLTSVGDLAMDRLGDLLFERGDFGGAQAAWESVVRDYPDGHLSIPKLQIKRCVALLRMGGREELEAVAGMVQEQYGDQKVTIGDEEVAAGPFVKGLVAELSERGLATTREAATTEAAGETATREVELGGEEPLWQIRVAPAGALEKMDAVIRNRGWTYFGTQFVGAIPGAVVDGKRVYVDWLGVVYAADLETGKMLWRTGKFSDIPEKAVNFVQYGVEMTHFAVSVAGGKVFATTQDLTRGEPITQMQCFDAATGKALWRGDRLGATWVSLPCVVGATGYSVGASGADGLYLIAFNMETGAQDWRVLLGKPTVAANYRGVLAMPDPAMVATTGMLYVATNNGALLAVNLSQRRVEWAFRHDTKFVNMERMGWSEDGPKPFETAATLLLDGGTLYVKDTGARIMYALDPMGPTLKWKRAIDSEDMAIGIDGESAYLLGKDLSAMGLKERGLLWSTKLPLENGNVRPLVGKEHIYVSTARGIYDIDPKNGDTRRIFRGADRESAGGKLFVAGDKLISVSDSVVTAYRAGGSAENRQGGKGIVGQGDKAAK